MATEAINVTGTSNTKDLVDLEAITLNWAKQIFEVTKTRDEAKISKKYLQYNINWSHAFNECLEPRYSLYGVDINSTKRSKSEQVLFKSTFTNSTDREQEYSFKTERATRSTVTVSVEKGVCRGIDMELKLKTPCEVAEANAGFHNEVSVVHIGENCIEEELSWGVDSTVRVPPMCETIAQLVIIEDHHTRNFSMECRLSGKVIVTVTNLKENNSLVTIIEGKIADIIRGLPNCSALGFVIKNDVVTYTTKGSCKFKYGVEQIVKISEHAILPSMLRRY
uniref:LIN-24 n=1 Tax=Ascaris lumbricoides TaxID=6252 RepID=A0A0M3IG47_ASCLU